MKRLTHEQLEAIRKRAEEAIGKRSIRAVYPEKAFAVLDEDIPALLAEVERLRKENAIYEQAVAEDDATKERLMAEIERLQDVLKGDGLLTLPDQVDHAREETERISAKFEDMTSIALWATRRLKHGFQKDFAYDAIERNLGEEVERL